MARWTRSSAPIGPRPPEFTTRRRCPFAALSIAARKGAREPGHAKSLALRPPPTSWDAECRSQRPASLALPEAYARKRQNQRLTACLKMVQWERSRGGWPFPSLSGGFIHRQAHRFCGWLLGISARRLRSAVRSQRSGAPLVCAFRCEVLVAIGSGSNCGGLESRRECHDHPRQVSRCRLCDRFGAPMPSCGGVWQQPR
jgi:hypothetical protein